MDYQLKTSLLPQKNDYNVVERVFAARGIAPENIKHYLNTTDEDILDPSSILNIVEGCKMLAKHIAGNSKIYLIVDSDVDGFTSAAALINYINSIFPSVAQNNIDYKIHTGKQHGILEEVVPEIIKNGYKLVIAPDSASNDYFQHQQLKESGIDVLIIDHHEAEKISENACVINNQLCDYPTKSLSGVGMVYKFCKQFDKLTGFDKAEDMLDLVALGEISDMMDIRDYETRRLITKGLESIKNPFMIEMTSVQAYSIEKSGGLNPHSVGWYIGPMINGTIRVGSMEEKILLFESMLDFKAYEQIPSTKRGCKGQYETKVQQACRNCSNIKRNQSKAVDETLEILEEIINREKLYENKIMAVKVKPNQLPSRNLTGLIATQLMSKYNHPFLILTEVIKEDGSITYEGSGRGYETKGFSDLRGFIADSGYSNLAQGHAQAFGVSIPKENFDDFIKYSNRELANLDFKPCSNVDFIWNAAQIKEQDARQLANLRNYWGQELEEPLIVIENIKITKDNIALLGSKIKNLKITLPNGLTAIKFFAKQDDYDSMVPDFENGYKTISILGTCSLNEFMGKITTQIEIKDYEITNDTKYYF